MGRSGAWQVGNYRTGFCKAPGCERPVKASAYCDACVKAHPNPKFYELAKRVYLRRNKNDADRYIKSIAVADLNEIFAFSWSKPENVSPCGYCEKGSCGLKAKINKDGLCPRCLITMPDKMKRDIWLCKEHSGDQRKIFSKYHKLIFLRNQMLPLLESRGEDTASTLAQIREYETGELAT